MPLVRLYSCGSLLFHKLYLPGYCSLKWIPHQADRWPHCCQRHFLPSAENGQDFPCICDSMNFCGLSTAAYPDKLVVFRIYSPFFAPALCGCALMEVLSMHRFSRSASALSSWKMRRRVRHPAICRNGCIPSGKDRIAEECQPRLPRFWPARTWH